MFTLNLIQFIVQKGIDVTIKYESHDNMVTFYFEKTVDKNRYVYAYSVLLFELKTWTNPSEAINCILEQAEYILKQHV